MQFAFPFQGCARCGNQVSGWNQCGLGDGRTIQGNQCAQWVHATCRGCTQAVLWGSFTQEQHGDGAVTGYFLGDAAQRPAFEPGTPMAAQHNEINLAGSSKGEDRVCLHTEESLSFGLDTFESR